MCKPTDSCDWSGPEDVIARTKTRQSWPQWPTAAAQRIRPWGRRSTPNLSGGVSCPVGIPCPVQWEKVPNVLSGEGRGYPLALAGATPLVDRQTENITFTGGNKLKNFMKMNYIFRKSVENSSDSSSWFVWGIGQTSDPHYYRSSTIHVWIHVVHWVRRTTCQLCG